MGSKGQRVDGPRACLESEFDEAVSLINRVFREGTDQDIRTDYPLVFDPSRTEYMRIVKVGGKVVAHVPVAPREVVALGDRFTIGIISPTVTHPDYRRRGYATLCLRDCIRIMEQKGWPVSALWTVVPTFSFYRHSDYEPVASQGWVVRLRPDDHKLFQQSPQRIVTYDPTTTEHLDTIVRMHDAQPYRVVRSRKEYQTLFSLPKIITYLALEGQEATGYLTVGEGVNKPGLIEAGGSTKALESLIGHVLRQRGSGRGVQALLPLTPTSLGQLVTAKMPGRRRPIEEADGVGHQMMRVNDLELLLRRMEHHLRQRSVGLCGDLCLVCEETGQGCTIQFRSGDVHLIPERTANPMVLTRRQLAQLIFGAHPTVEPVKCDGPAGEIVQRVFPYHVPIWELDHS